MNIAILAPTLERGLYVLNDMIQQNEDIFVAFYGKGAKDNQDNEYHVCTRQMDIAGHVFDQMFIAPFEFNDKKFRDLIGYTRQHLTGCVPEQFEMIYYDEG